MQLEHVRFVGSAGAELAGVVRRPPGEVVGSALIAHCFTCGKDLHTTARLSKALTRAAVTLIERNAGPCLLIGHSLGGAAAVLAASRLKTVARVIAIASPGDVAHVDHLFADAPRIEDGSACATIGGRVFRIGAKFQADLERHDVTAAAATLDRPFLVVQAGADTVVGTEQTRRLAEAGGADLVTIEGADHLFTGPEASRRLAEAVLAWLDRT